MSLKHDDKTLTQTIGNARAVWRTRSMREGLQNEEASWSELMGPS